MIHVCFGIYDKTGCYSKFIGTTMLSLFENLSAPPQSTTVHILHDNTLTQDNREKFIYVADKYNQCVNFYNVEELCADKMSKINTLFSAAAKTRYTMGMFYRFFIPDVLSTDIEKAIYLDADIIVNLDLNELWQIELGDKILGVIPARAIGNDIHVKDKMVKNGLVKPNDYFNSGVLLMNLKLLRDEWPTIVDGMNFCIKHKYIKYPDQQILNKCFATRSLKLPVKYNQFVRWARTKKEPVMQMIYHYTGSHLQLDTTDPFNRLWMKYFLKTPWFDLHVFGRLCADFEKILDDSKKAQINLSSAMIGKTRCFFIKPKQLAALKKIFSIREDEEIILAENKTSLKKLLDTMKKFRNQKFFIITTEKFPIKLLTKAGFVEGKDYLKGWELFTAEQGYPFNSYPLIQNI